MLSAAVSDSLGHAVQFHWESSCAGVAEGGSFAPNATTASPTWTPPPAPVGKDVSCVLALTASDGAGTNLQASYVHTIRGPEAPHGITFVQPASTASPLVTSGAATTLNASATDSHGHALTYQWSASCPGGAGTGTFGSAAAGTAATTWTAPSNATSAELTCTLVVEARDAQGTSARSSVSQRVGAGATPHSLTFTALPAASPNPATAGVAVALSAAATDSNGHALTYQWSVSCNGGIGHGNLANPGAAATVWTTPIVAAGEIQTCAVAVTVSDGQGLSQTRSVTQVLSRQTRHTLTLTGAPKGTPNTAPDGQPIVMSVTAVDSHVHPLQYLWQASCDAASGGGTWSPDANAAAPTWRPPVNKTRVEMSCLVRVSVIDDRGLFAQGSYVQRVAPPLAAIETTSAPLPEPPPAQASAGETTPPVNPPVTVVPPPVVAPPVVVPPVVSATPAFSRYLAEGAIGSFFNTRLALLNISPDPARATLRFQKTDGTEVTTTLVVAPKSRATVEPARVVGMTPGEFATRIDSDLELVVERTMTWGAAGAGAHAETAVTAPSTRWVFAEGTTRPGHDMFLLLSNPGTTADAEVRVRYLLPRGDPVDQVYIVPRQSRQTVWVNRAAEAGVAALDSVDMALVLDSLNDVPVVAEQAIYVSPNEDRPFSGGASGAGVTAPASTWYFADGSTAGGAETYLLLANPDAERAAEVRLTYRRPDGRTFSRTVTVAASQRQTLPVAFEAFEDETALANLAAFSMQVESVNGVAVVAERSVWWPTGDRRGLAEGHRSAGATGGGLAWAMADGELGGPSAAETHVLILNTAAVTGRARVTVLPESGAPQETTVTVPATGRLDVNLGTAFPQLRGRFGVLVESVGTAPVPLVVERSTYTSGPSARSGGTNVIGARLR